MMLNKIHHVGVAVPSIEKALEFHILSLNMKKVSEIVYDEIQQVKVVLLGYNNQSADQALIELVEPTESSTPIDSVLKQKNHLYHYCVEVPSLDEALLKARENYAIIVRRPTPSALFNGRRIAFVWTPAQYLLEFLEK